MTDIIQTTIPPSLCVYMCVCVPVHMCVSRRTSEWSVHLGRLAKGWTVVVLFELNAKILSVCACVYVRVESGCPEAKMSTDHNGQTDRLIDTKEE